MKYYYIRPEVPGGVGVNTTYDKSTIPWTLMHFHLIMEGWLGGDILKVSNAFMVTEGLEAELVSSELSGIKSFEMVEIDSSDTFKKLYPNRKLPKLKRMVIDGELGEDDFVIKDHMKLLVSERVMETLNNFDLSDLEMHSMVIYK